MIIRWLVEGRSGDSQLDISKLKIDDANRHFFPCDSTMPCHPESSEGSHYLRVNMNKIINNNNRYTIYTKF